MDLLYKSITQQLLSAIYLRKVKQLMFCLNQQHTFFGKRTAVPASYNLIRF